MIYGPDSSAHITIQAAEQIRQWGTLAPFSVTSPLAPLLVASLAAATGISEQLAYLMVVTAAYCGGCAAVFFLVASLSHDRALAAGSALLFGAAPSRVFFVLGEPDAPRLLFWSLVPLLTMAVHRVLGGRTAAKLPMAFVVAGGCLATLPISWGAVDLLALAELYAVCTLPFLSGRRFAVPALGTCMAVFLAPSAWLLGVYPSLVYLPTEMPQEALVWAKENSADGRVFGPVSLEVLSEANWKRAEHVIRISGRTDESLLWLQAMGTEYLISRDWPKFHSLLECVHQQGEWCAYRLPAPNHSRAVLVSRRQWENLKPLRGAYDVEGLQAYLRWALRPEPAGISWNSATEAEIQADLGPYDAILVRTPFRPGWVAWLENGSAGRRPINVSRDPLDFIVVDPRETGPVSVRLQYSPTWRDRLLPLQSDESPFVEGDFPIISRDGIADAMDYTPPPFRPGATLTIFGHNFVTGQTRVLFGERSGEVRYVGPRQINVVVPNDLQPGSVQVVVESEGRRSYPRIVEVSR